MRWIWFHSHESCSNFLKKITLSSNVRFNFPNTTIREKLIAELKSIFFLRKVNGENRLFARTRCRNRRITVTPKFFNKWTSFTRCMSATVGLALKFSWKRVILFKIEIHLIDECVEKWKSSSPNMPLVLSLITLHIIRMCYTVYWGLVQALKNRNFQDSLLDRLRPCEAKPNQFFLFSTRV